MKHNANFKYDLEWGKQGETVVAEIQQGEKTEVKSERDKWIKTGNHYCEYQSREKKVGLPRHRLNGGPLISTVKISFVLI